MRLLTIDMETVDKYIGLGLGGGWCYPRNEEMFRALGWSTQELCSGNVEYRVYLQDNLRVLKTELNTYDGIIGHNLAYDLGCLEWLGIDTHKLLVYDILIISKLYNNELHSHSLDSLAKEYLNIDTQKQNDLLIKCAIETGLVALPKRIGYSQERFYKKVLAWCKTNMDKLPVEVVATYCNADVKVTSELFLKMVEV